MPSPAVFDPISGKYRLTEPTGYVRMYDDVPTKQTYLNYIYEHRKAMEDSLQRQLAKGEIIHHMDGNKSNNAIDNLRLIVNNLDHMQSEHQAAVPGSKGRFLTLAQKVELLRAAGQL